MHRFIILGAVLLTLCLPALPAAAGPPDAIRPAPVPSSCGDCYWGSYAMGKGADAALAAWNSFNQANTCSSPPWGGISWRTLFLGAINEGEDAENALFQAYSSSCDCQLAGLGRRNAESALLYVNAALEMADLYCTQVDPWVSHMGSAQSWYQAGAGAAQNCEDQSCGIVQ